MSVSKTVALEAIRNAAWSLARLARAFAQDGVTFQKDWLSMEQFAENIAETAHCLLLEAEQE